MLMRSYAAAVLSLMSFTLVGAINKPSSKAVVLVVRTKKELQDARTAHVREILEGRLQAVLSGARSRQFQKWTSKRGAEVVSFLEEVDFDFDAEGGQIVPLSTRDGLFPENAIDLSLVPVEGLPSQFQGKPVHLAENRKPSIVDLMLRSMRLGINFAPATATAWLAFLLPVFRRNIWNSLVASSLASSGPAFIKWGQWASTRSDMFPESLCLALSKLHNDAPTHPWWYTQKVMESSLGLPKGSLLEVFDSFSKVPLASGSIAQVHKAELGGRTIIAKVRHPKIAKLMEMDFRIMEIAAFVADCLPALSWLHIRDTVEQFSHTMAAQAHLNVEGHHLEVLNKNFASWKQVRFPQPLYASSGVILETFESGSIVTTILDRYDSIASETPTERGTLTVEEAEDEPETDKGHQILPLSVAKFIVTTGLSLYLKMLLVDRLMHADLHPGNIMLDLTTKTKGTNETTITPRDDAAIQKQNLRVTLVDAGMVAQLSPEESTNFIGLLCSLGEGNGKAAAKCALRFSTDSKLSSNEEQAFIGAMEELFKERCRGYYTNVDVGHVLRGILGLIRDHRVRIDANYATLVVNCLCVEGLAQRVCPSYNLLDAAKPLLQSYQSLCYKGKDGSPNEKPSALSRGLVQLSMPLAYLRKSLFDDSFFSRQRRTARDKHQRKSN